MMHFTAELFPWLRTREPGVTKQCVMMFTPPMGNGLCILGMPFFRNYMVHFDKETRSISTAPQDGECKPAKASFMEMETAPKLKLIDASKFRFSNSYHRLSQIKTIDQVVRKGSFL